MYAAIVYYVISQKGFELLEISTYFHKTILSIYIHKTTTLSGHYLDKWNFGLTHKPEKLKQAISVSVSSATRPVFVCFSHKKGGESATAGSYIVIYISREDQTINGTNSYFKNERVGIFPKNTGAFLVWVKVAAISV